ncbi:fumarate hydratase [Patescibacteria group bacterium]|nr:fumarate hydratase [Patescibacteria group bacterium]
MRIRMHSYHEVVAAAANLCREANFYIPQNTRALLEQSFQNEESELGKMVLERISENAKIAAEEQMPLCQDCGSALVFLEIGEQFRIRGGNVIDAVSEGVRRGYREGYLRKSMCHPLTRKNTGDNTPAVIHTDIVKGTRLKIIVMPKGGGSENMTKLKMLTPSAGKKGIADFAVQSVVEADGNPCPPLILGIGIGGGSAERTMFLSKKALLRATNSAHSNPEIAALESEILERVNQTGIGPQGLGGRITAMACFIEWEPCHIASLPVAINLLCHSARHAEVRL